MQHKKEFFGVLLSVLVCVFLVFLAVYATTTVGSDITVEDDLTVTDDLIVTGLASVTEDIWVDRIYGTRGDGYLSVGDAAATDHSLVSEDDLLVTGKLEVDGTVYFDGNVSLSDSSVLYTTDIIGVRDAGLYLIIGDEALTSHSLAANDDLLVSGKLEVDGIAYFDGLVSVSNANGLVIGGGAKIFGGTASPTGATLSCATGSIYIRAGGGIDTLIARCEAADSWDYLDLTE